MGPGVFCLWNFGPLAAAHPESAAEAPISQTWCWSPERAEGRCASRELFASTSRRHRPAPSKLQPVTAGFANLSPKKNKWRPRSHRQGTLGCPETRFFLESDRKDLRSFRRHFVMSGSMKIEKGSRSYRLLNWFYSGLNNS